MARVKKRKLSKKEEKAAHKADGFAIERENNLNLSERAKPVEKAKKIVSIPEIVSVKDLADRAGLAVTQVISALIKNGVLASINQTIDFETAAIVGDDLNLEIVHEKEGANRPVQQKEVHTTTNEADLEIRPPVVTVMGHVDHGKTTLLDKIRSAKVAEGESGGITQHISAYQVNLASTKNPDIKSRTITFLDTPGHAAFSRMREHGTTITDIVVLIVAADDGVMPQTAEVIEKAKSNNVPIIVAINKVDLPDADVMKVKQQLTEYELVPEEWGGKTVIVEISAKTGAGVDDLLEMILLQADLLEFKANPKDKAVGVIIESHMEVGRGAVALALVENGTIHQGEAVAIGRSYGRVRILENQSGKKIVSAGPSSPVRIAGLKSLPGFGDRLLAFDNEKEAKDAAMKDQRLHSTLHVATAKRVAGENGDEDKIELVQLNLVIKSDVVGSLEAIKKLISEIKSKEVSVQIISEGVGPISESDITLAIATGAEVIGFRVPVLMAARKIADKDKISLKTFDVIYELVDDIKATLSAALPPLIIEEELGRAKVLAIFRDDKKGVVVGGRIEDGRISSRDSVKILQDGNMKYSAKLSSLRQEKNEVKDCSVGTECGFGLPAGANVAVGDTLVAYKTIEKERTVE
ncbi:MAG: translation initiation factor IF-2 [Patescibacteria group bacterium]|jgi:translation initiation factor IF-2